MGSYADFMLAALRVALQELPGGGTERVLVGPEEYRRAFRLENREDGGYTFVERATGIRHVRVPRPEPEGGFTRYREIPLGSSRSHYVRISARNPYDENSGVLRVVRATDPVDAPSSAAFGPVQRGRGEHAVVVSPVAHAASTSAASTSTGRLPMPHVVVDTRDGRILEEIVPAGGEGPAVYWWVDHDHRQAVPLDAAGREVLGEGGASLKPKPKMVVDTPVLLFLDGDGNVVLDRTVHNPLDEWASAAGSDDLVSAGEWEVAGEVRGDIVFGGGSSRLSPEARQVIEELAARTVRDSVAALDAGRPVPVVTITGHSNGTWFDQSRSGLALRRAEQRADALRDTARRSGQERADAVATAFATAFLRGLRRELGAARRLGEYLAAAAAQGGAVLDSYGLPVAVMSRGRAYPPVNPRPEDGTARLPERGPDARRRAVITIRNFRRAAEPEATQLSGDADAGSEQADAGQGASQLRIAAQQAQDPQVETHTMPPPIDAPGVLQQVAGFAGQADAHPEESGSAEAVGESVSRPEPEPGTVPSEAGEPGTAPPESDAPSFPAGTSEVAAQEAPDSAETQAEAAEAAQRRYDADPQPREDQFPEAQFPEDQFPPLIADAYRQVLQEARDAGVGEVPAADLPVEQSQVRGLDAFEHWVDVLERTGRLPGELHEMEQVIGDARDEARRRRAPLSSLHQGSRALRSAAYEQLLRDAQETLRSYREGRSAELGAGFTVTELPGDGHAVVYHGPANEPGNRQGNEPGDVPALRIEFDSRQRWTSREYLLGNPPPTMDGLRAVADRTWGPGDEENGAGRITYRLTGNDPGAVTRFAVHTVPPESAEYVHGPFVATDGGNGRRFHFGPEGTFTAQDRPLEGGWAYLRTEVGVPHGAPRLLDPQGVTWEDWQVGNPVGRDGNPVIARIEVRPVNAMRPVDEGGAPHQRMVFDLGNGRLLLEVVPLRDRRGRLVGYAAVDRSPHFDESDEPNRVRRFDVDGRVLRGSPLTMNREPGGFLTVGNLKGRVLFSRSAWGAETEPLSIAAPGPDQFAQRTEPPRGTIALPFLRNDRGDFLEVRLGATVVGGGPRRFQITAPTDAPGMRLREIGLQFPGVPGRHDRYVDGQIVRYGDRFVIRRALFAARPFADEAPDGPMMEHWLDAGRAVESESLILGGPYDDPRIAELRVALQERPGGGTERVLTGPEEHRGAFRLASREDGGFALVETARGIRHLYGPLGEALYREVPSALYREVPSRSSRRSYDRLFVGNHASHMIDELGTDFQDRPGHARGRERVLAGPEEFRRAFRLENREDGGYAFVERATGIRHAFSGDRRGVPLYREVPLGSSRRHYVRIAERNSLDLRVVRDTDPVDAPSSAAFGPVQRLSEHAVVVSPVDAQVVPAGRHRLPMPRVVVDLRDGRILEEVLPAGGEGPAVYWRVNYLVLQAVPVDAAGQEVLGEDGSSLGLEPRTMTGSPVLMFLDGDGNVVLDRTRHNPLDEWAPAAGSDDLVSTGEWETAGEVAGNIVFDGGSSRLSPEARQVIEELAARTVRDSVAALDEGRPLPVVTITGHSNGTWFDQSRSGLDLLRAEQRAGALRDTARRSGQERADAVALAFVEQLRQQLEAAGPLRQQLEEYQAEAERLREYLAATAAAGGTVRHSFGVPVVVMSRGRDYPSGTGPEGGPDARRRAVLTIRRLRRAAEPEAIQLPGDADAGSEQADAGQGASQLHIAAQQAQGEPDGTYTVPSADAPGVLQQVVVEGVSGQSEAGPSTWSDATRSDATRSDADRSDADRPGDPLDPPCAVRGRHRPCAVRGRPRRGCRGERAVDRRGTG